jgi:integrase
MGRSPVKADPLLPLYQAQHSGRAGRDRLELLTALINGPAFDPMLRAEVIRVPADHPVFGWACQVPGCERPRTGSLDMCHVHREQWAQARADGAGKAAFLAAAQPLSRAIWAEQVPCRICPGRPATHTGWRLCHRHSMRWYHHQRGEGEQASFGDWLSGQVPFGGYGSCQVAVCPDLAATPLGLCSGHEGRYRDAGRPGDVALPSSWSRRYEQQGLPVPVPRRDGGQFRSWCAAQPPMPWPGQVNLLGLAALAAAEIRWGLFAHTQRERRTRWDTGWVQALANTCRERGTGSLTRLDLPSCTTFAAMVAREMLHDLRLAYFTPETSRDAGFIETDHFGMRFPDRGSHFDLTGIAQRWLRDLLWDYLASLLASPECPRTGGTFDAFRRAATELGAFLAVDAPAGGHDPATLTAAHIQRFAADQRHREREGLASLVMRRQDGTPSIVTTTTRAITFNHARKLLRWALDCGAAERAGLGRQFITAMPAAGPTLVRKRSPFPDEVARALADEANLARLAALDPADFGLRDIWETIIVTGRRVSEVLGLRLDCTGRYGGLAMLWHDQTKTGRYDQAIRIPEPLFQRLAERRETTVSRFTARHGRPPAAAERTAMALFPGRYRNPDGTAAVTYQWFHLRFKAWVDELDIGRWVAHQARHTLATSLLRHGATLTHIRRYLGHVSDRMAEHYIQLSHSDLEDVLQHVWVAGPGTPSPGTLLSGPATPITREQAQTLAIDLSRRSTPADGGFCTFQPVVDGGACPWNLDCHNCAKFVLSGADLLYWRRKREQWYSIAERAPDDATANWLHEVFAPTAAAIDGLQAALARLGLLDDALALDLRRPQDYFQRVWNIGFRATELASASADTGAVLDGHTDADGEMEETA